MRPEHGERVVDGLRSASGRAGPRASGRICGRWAKGARTHTQQECGHQGCKAAMIALDQITPRPFRHDDRRPAWKACANAHLFFCPPCAAVRDGARHGDRPHVLDGLEDGL